MFKPGDLVQPRVDGPKLKATEVNNDRIAVAQASSENGDRFTLKTAGVTRCTEEGNFGVC